MRRLTFLLFSLFLGVGLMYAQTKVSGTVISEEDGQPVVGAAVQAVGQATVGTITDYDGKFHLEVPAGVKLLKFSYLGLEPVELPVKSVMNVRMKSSAEALDEVMVVAFGTAKKSAFTGSASTINTEAITSRQTANITNALAGQVSGVQVTSSNGQPGSSATVRIRGVGSMAASNAPLYVVDGVPFDGDLATLNPNDIQSMTVLKDAASNALYGARGANGVILITTKRGASGEAVINFDAKWGSNKRAIPNYDVMESPSAYYEKAYQAIFNSKFKGDNLDEAWAYANKTIFTNQNGGLGYQVYTFPEGQSFIEKNGLINPQAKLGYVEGDYYYLPDNWYNELFDNGNMRQEYNMSLSGSSDKMNYYMSVGYLDDSGIIANSGFSRLSTRLKTDYQVKKWLKVGANLSYTYYDSKTPDSQTSNGSSGNLFYVSNLMAPIYPFYVRNADGSIKVDSHGYTVYDFGDGKSSGFIRPFMNQSNPASLIELDKRSYKGDVFGAKWFAHIDLYEGLKFQANIGLDINNNRYTYLRNKYYGQYAGATGGIITVGHRRQYGLNQQYLLTYIKTLGEHTFDVLAGVENYNYKYSYLNGSQKKLYNPNIPEIDNAILDPSVSSYTNKYSTMGYLARAQYDYATKYFASVSYRRDGSSRFNPDSRWGNFWSIGGGWLMNKESFLQSQSWIDMLKFKISYGVQGNDNLLYNDGTVNYYPYQDQFQLSDSNGNFSTSMFYKGNKDITWETSHSFNTGFDFEFFKGRLNGTLEYFNRKTSDLLYYMPVNPSVGYSLYPVNVGDIRNSGFEIDLNGDLYRNKNVVWSMNVNMTFLKNKILKLESSLGGQMVDGSRIYKEGESMYQMYLRKYAGVNPENGESLWYMDMLEGGKVVGQEKTNDWSKATRYATGDLLPTVYGGFGTSIRLYGFDASIAFAYQLGGKIYDGNYASLMHGGTASDAGKNWHKDISNSWTENNKSTDVPRVQSTDKYTNSASDRFLVSSDYLSLQNITVGYTLPRAWTQKVFIDNVRLYMVADNIAFISARKGLDSRQSYIQTSNTYSPIKSISGGINVTF